MYKIKNITRGSLSIILEKGSIILTSGSIYDLDGVCSRKWINYNTELRKLINSGCIIIVTDTEKNLVKTPIKDVANSDKIVDVYVKQERPKPSKKDLCIAYRNAKLAGLNINPNHKKIDLFDNTNCTYDTPEVVSKELKINIPTFNYKNDNEPIFLDFTKILEESSVPILENKKVEDNKFPMVSELEDPIEEIINNNNLKNKG